MIYGTIAGRIAKDAEVRFTSSGTSVAGFTIACDVGFGDNKHAVFTRCSMWGKRGEAVAPYLTKGATVTAVGTMDLREWEANGKSGFNLELNVQGLVLQGKSGKQETKPEAGFRDKPAPEAAASDFADDDIPW